MPDLLASLLQLPFNLLNRSARPVTTGALKLPGLRARVEVIRDQWGIPHIYAANHHDLFVAQGFVHAQERMWQMEMNRRMAMGQLAAAFGELALDTDRLTRTLGFTRLAQADLALLDDYAREAGEAYAEGVNAFLDRRKLPVEFTLTGLRPARWTVIDSLAIARVMLFNLSTSWSSELVRAQLIEKLGPERAADLDIKWPERDTLCATLPDGIVFNRLQPDGKMLAERGPFLGRVAEGGGRGSNAWAIAGWRSTTGKPILCNDMHLKITTPGIWYIIHLVGGEYEVTGASVAGIPGVEVGHNAHIAWGATLTFSDAQDLFVEKLDPANPRRYDFRGEWHDCEVIQEEIAVKGRATPHVEEVRITRHGPLICAPLPEVGDTITLNSYALRPSPAMNGFLRLDRARGWDDFVDAVREITAPQLNIMYADALGERGNIGYWVTGTHPVRAKGQGTIPVPGWSGEYEWVGEIPFEEMPHALNPERGYIVSCNHRIVDTDDPTGTSRDAPAGRLYPHFLGLHWMNGYRAQRLVAEIERKGRLSPDDCRAFHMDFHSLPGLELVRRLKDLSLSPADPDAALALKLLMDWNGWLGADSVGGTVYEVTLTRLVHNLIEPALDPELFDKFMGGKGPHPLLYPNTEFLGHSTVTVFAMLDDPDSVWVKDAGGREAVMEKSLAEAARWLKEKLGPDPAGWQWGKLHQITLPHSLAVAPHRRRHRHRVPDRLQPGRALSPGCVRALLPRDR
ncbi:MAG: Penicillin acylase family protein [Anaerolineales bacterium]|nr:Penicillin acylase family protein [Anaerolineales bacterium]